MLVLTRREYTHGYTDYRLEVTDTFIAKLQMYMDTYIITDKNYTITKDAVRALWLGNVYEDHKTYDWMFDEIKISFDGGKHIHTAQVYDFLMSEIQQDLFENIHDEDCEVDDWDNDIIDNGNSDNC